MISRVLTLCLISLTTVLLLVACGSEVVGSEGSGSAGDDENAPSISKIDQMFTTDSFIAAGWKKSKEYDTATVPGATDIWYGFFNQKDIEIRFYENHQAALDQGITSAKDSVEGAVKRSKGGKLLDFSGGSFTGYADFMIVGNAILLCEFDLTQCETLVGQLD